MNTSTCCPAVVEPVYIIHDAVPGVTYTMQTVHGPIKFMVAAKTPAPSMPTELRLPAFPLPILPTPPPKTSAATTTPLPAAPVEPSTPSSAETAAAAETLLNISSDTDDEGAPAEDVEIIPVVKMLIWTEPRKELLAKSFASLRAEGVPLTPLPALKRLQKLAKGTPEEAWANKLERVQVSSRIQRLRERTRRLTQPKTKPVPKTTPAVKWSFSDDE